MTIQEAIRNCNRKEVISEYIYKYAFNKFELCGEQYNDITIGQIKQNITKHLNEVMDKICNATPTPSDDREVLLAVHVTDDDDDIDFNLYRAEELLNENDFYQAYGYEFTPLEETLNFEVADTYLTKFYLNELIATYLFEVTWTGWNQEFLKKELDEIDESAKEAKEHPERLKKWDSEAFRKEFNLEEEDPQQKEAWFKLIRQQCEYNQKCTQIEIEKWRKLHKK